MRPLSCWKGIRDEHAAHALEHLPRREIHGVAVIPVDARRVVRRDGELANLKNAVSGRERKDVCVCVHQILERAAGVDFGEYIVNARHRGEIHAVPVDVGSTEPSGKTAREPKTS